MIVCKHSGFNHEVQEENCKGCISGQALFTMFLQDYHYVKLTISTALPSVVCIFRYWTFTSCNASYYNLREARPQECYYEQQL